MRQMRNMTRYSAALSVAFGFGLVACEDDSGTVADTTVTETTTQTDTNVGSEATTAAEVTAESETTVPSETTGSETTPTDPCAEPNPCTHPPAKGCDDMGMVVTYAATGTCTDANHDGTAECDYAPTETACTDNKVCAGGECVAGADACDYTFDAKASFVTSIKLGNKDGQPDACCFDFNGDGKVDNKLGSILKSFASLFDVDKTITDQIAAGKLILLLETKDLGADIVNDTDLALYGFYGEDAREGTHDNTDGMGHFKSYKASFQPGTQQPLIAFENATIATSVLKAGPSLFQLSIPIVGAQLDIKVSETKIEADAIDGPNAEGGLALGQTGLGAKLGGVIAKTDLVSALNAYIATCECVNFQVCAGTKKACETDAECTTGAKKCVTTAADHILIGTDGLCNEAATDTCGTDDAACAQIPGFCSVVLAALSPDVDLDGDGTKDGISVGVWVKATSATIDGVVDMSGEPPVDQCLPL